MAAFLFFLISVLVLLIRPVTSGMKVLRFPRRVTLEEEKKKKP